MCTPNSQRLCNDNNCEICFEKSFASHFRARYWSVENVLTPRQVFKHSRSKYIFDCEGNCLFEISLTNINKGYWCPYSAGLMQQQIQVPMVLN